MSVTTPEYAAARSKFAQWGVDVDAALRKLQDIAISVHCWQGDDVGGFEAVGDVSGGGIQATGNYPGRARTPAELRADLEKAYSLIPGKHRLNLHAIYLDTDETPARNKLEFRHFASWADWAKENGLGIDFNPTFFAHPQANDNLTLAHPDAAVRDFWVEHGECCRKIAAEFGRVLGTPCVNNIWIPDGLKDLPVDRLALRARLEDSLDRMFADKYDKAQLKDAVESKLFGIGVEACTVGSHEFYLGYAIRNGLLLCLDTGHFHPTESVADKLSAVSLSVEEMLLHVSRPMRWDSDHVILLNDDLYMLAHELVAGDLLSRTNIGLDFFDATINRIAAWAIGTRNMQKALLFALLQPMDRLKTAELDLNFSDRFVLREELKDLPYGTVWEAFCERNGVPSGQTLLADLNAYQKSIAARG